MTGHRLVPVEPTLGMGDAGIATLGRDDDRFPSEIIADAWDAMVGAAPVFIPSDAQVEGVASEICHYRKPSNYNSCCASPMGEKRCQVLARAIFAALPQILAEEPAERAAGDAG